MSEALKRCPFCGGEAGLFTTNVNAMVAYMPERLSYTAKCLDCQCSTPACFNREGAVNGWNKRHSEADELVYPLMRDVYLFYKNPGRFHEYAVSVDYGTINPCSAGIWGHNFNSWYRIAEYYFDSRKEGYQRTDAEYYEEICKLIGDKRIKAFIIEPSAASFIETVRRAGRLPVVLAEDNLTKGVSQVRAALSDGSIKICDSCKNAIREFREYKQDVFTYKPIRRNDHAMDDIRYFVSVMFR